MKNGGPLIKIDGKSPVNFATFAPLHVYSNHGYKRNESTYICIGITCYKISTLGMS